MKRRHHLLMLAFLLTFAMAQAQVKVGANPGSLTTGAVLDAEGSSGARTVIMNDGRVGVNTTNPNTSADLELGSGNKALYLNRVSSTSAITAPQPGMVIYDLSVGCVKSYQGNPAAWSGCLSGSSANAGGSGTVSGLSCSSASFSPSSATANVPYSGTLTVPYTGGNGGTYTAQSFTQNWLSVSLPAGSFASGSGNIYYTISGTPTSSGSVSVSLSVGGQSCASGSISALPVNAAPPSNPAGTGSLSGRTCFDIAESNDNVNSCGALSGRTVNRANFNQNVTYNQTYVFTASGNVSNVRFVFVNTNGQVIQSLTPSANYSGTLSSGSSASAVAAYNQDLSSDVPGSSPTNGLAYGLTSSNPLTADIYVVYNDGSNGAGTDKQLKLTANVKDCACCGAYVAAGVWKNFMCHNVGADYTADPFTPAAAIHGAKYQWGYDGINATNYLTQSKDQAQSGSVPWNTSNNFPPPDNWNAGSETYPHKSAYDPCPAGYRVPTKAEFLGVANNSLNPQTKIGSFTSSPTNYGTAYKLGNFLMLPVAGARASNNGALYNRGSLGWYWSSKSAATSFSDPNATVDAYLLYLDSTSARVIASQNNAATAGGSIRCITE